MNSKDIQDIVYNISYEFDNLLSWSAYYYLIKLKNPNLSSKEINDKYRNLYNNEYGFLYTLEGLKSIKCSAIIVAYLLIDIETHIPEYNFTKTNLLSDTRRIVK